jgi:TPR repeat protein
VDRAKAHKYFQQAADMGHLPAQKEIAVSMIKGHRGLFRIPQGIFMFARALSKLIKLALSDADNDRIRW